MATPTRTGTEFRINTYTTGDQGLVSVASLSGGGFVVTWGSDGQDGSGSGAYGQRYDATGVALGDEFRINMHTANDQWEPFVTGLSDGGFVVTWVSNGQDGSNGGIYGQRYNESGAALGGEFRINTHTANAQEAPSVTSLSDGGFVVTWQSEHQDGSSWGIYGQRYNAQGTAVGVEFRVNTHTANSQVGRSVASLSDGGIMRKVWRKGVNSRSTHSRPGIRKSPL